MDKFDRVPQTVEAERFTGGDESAAAIEEWVSNYGTTVERTSSITPTGYVETLTLRNPSGVMMVSPGDWVVRDQYNNFSGWFNDDFEANYEEEEVTE